MSENMNQHQENKEKTATTPTVHSANRDSRYWLSLEQWGNDPEFQKIAEQEFQSSPLREEEHVNSDRDGGWARREFLKLMGASLAMATAGCIRRPVQKIVPYNKAVEEITFGVPNFYTSTYFDGSEGLGLLIKTREGRPIKIEGNPHHPLNLGASSAKAQAHILSLYDPERLQEPKKNLLNKDRTNRDTISTQWEDADKDIAAKLGKGGVVLLSGAIASPSSRALISEFCLGYKARHVVWEPLAYDEVREGQKASYGEDVVPFYHFDKAKMIVSVDADFLGAWLAPTAFSKQFAAARKDPKTMSKLVVFDSNYSLTGANADTRVRIKPSQQLAVVMGLAYQIIVKQGHSKFAGNGAVKAVLSTFADSASRLGISEDLFARMASDLWVNKGQSLIVAGGLPTQTTQAKELQVAVNFLNSALENDGITIDSKSAFTGLKGSSKAMLDLLADMKKGAVKTLIIHGVNPGYALAQSVGFLEATKGVGTIIYTGDRMDETGLLAHYVLPDNHSMESWSDVEVVDGIVSIQQPTIRPMYNTRSFQLSLMTWAKLSKIGSKRLNSSETFYDYVRSFWKEDFHPKYGKGKSFETFWDDSLQAGVVDAGKLKKTGAARNFKVEALSTIKSVGGKSLELVLYPTVALGDGKLANVSWLQELPDPVTKICWDNYASISLALAEKLKAQQGDLFEVTVGSEKMTLPINIQPGLHDEVVAIAVGYGRTHVGKIGNNVGTNAFDLVQIQKGNLVASGLEVGLLKLNKDSKLACTGGHYSMEGRKIVAEATLQEYLKEHEANNHRHHVFSIWGGHQYNGNKWGMSVDLNTCTGCSACVVACQSENNIPVVGKKYVLQGRHMSWIRIDRYYVGDPKDANAVFQPVMCQQCDNAPCETVCPVVATAHSSEGLNDMAYNRCVGTRYCSNNCPYKVRRFNWFNFTGAVEKPLNMAYNPDVTVRPRGVMEKCSFCVQRIKSTKQQVRLENRELKDGDIKTACEQVCPTNAIIFGDLNNPESRVAKIFKDEPRAYGLLEEFNAAPSVRYLTKIRNKETHV